LNLLVGTSGAFIVGYEDTGVNLVWTKRTPQDEALGKKNITVDDMKCRTDSFTINASRVKSHFVIRSRLVTLHSNL